MEPAVSGEQRRRLIAGALTALTDPALRIKVGALPTVVEGPLDDALHAVQRAHLAAATGAERVVASVRIENRKGVADLGGPPCRGGGAASRLGRRDDAADGSRAKLDR
ncbi:hypothetical protein BH20ACT8_BH20ACT8_07620 [soil metagenome]